jgi:hypothetical protein
MRFVFVAIFSRYRRTAFDERIEGSGPGPFHCPALGPLLLDVLSERLVAEEPSRAAALIIIGARRQDRCLRPTLLFPLLPRDPRSFSPRFALGHFVAAVARLRCCSAVFGQSSLLIFFGRFWPFVDGGCPNRRFWSSSRLDVFPTGLRWFR